METHLKTIVVIFAATLLISANLHADPVSQAFEEVGLGRQELIKGHPKPAEKHFIHALHLFPGWYRPALGMAVVRLQSGRPKAALKWLNKALRSEPDRWDTQLTAGRVMEATGHPKQAMKYYLKALPFSTTHRDLIRDYACALGSRVPETQNIAGFRKLGCYVGQKNNQ